MSLVFFTDRNVGRNDFPRILREAGLAVECHDDHFAQTAADQEWAAEVGRRGWVILSYDETMLRNPVERDAIMRVNGRAFLLVGSNATAVEMATNFVNTRRAVEALIAIQPTPFIAKLYRPNPTSDIYQGKPGRVELKLHAGTWKPAF